MKILSYESPTNRKLNTVTLFYSVLLLEWIINRFERTVSSNHIKNNTLHPVTVSATVNTQSHLRAILKWTLKFLKFGTATMKFQHHVTVNITSAHNRYSRWYSDNATGWKIERSQFESLQVKYIFSCFTKPKPILNPHRPLSNGKCRISSLGLCKRDTVATHLFLGQRLRISGAITSIPIHPHGIMLNYAQGRFKTLY